MGLRQAVQGIPNSLQEREGHDDSTAHPHILGNVEEGMLDKDTRGHGMLSDRGLGYTATVRRFGNRCWKFKCIRQFINGHHCLVAVELERTSVPASYCSEFLQRSCIVSSNCNTLNRTWNTCAIHVVYMVCAVV